MLTGESRIEPAPQRVLQAAPMYIGTSQLRVIDDGLEYNVTNIVRQVEGRARRRMMLIEGVAIP